MGDRGFIPESSDNFWGLKLRCRLLLAYKPDKFVSKAWESYQDFREKNNWVTITLVSFAAVFRLVTPKNGCEGEYN